LHLQAEKFSDTRDAAFEFPICCGDLHDAGGLLDRGSGTADARSTAGPDSDASGQGFDSGRRSSPGDVCASGDGPAWGTTSFLWATRKSTAPVRRSRFFSSLPDRRIEVRFGKFSIVDFFDTNTYGTDTTLQFMNWTVDNHGAYDYAADT